MEVARSFGVVGVTETAYIWYSESTDFAFILLSGFCGNCPTKVVKQVPQILLIKVWLPDRIISSVLPEL